MGLLVKETCKLRPFLWVYTVPVSDTILHASGKKDLHLQTMM